MELPAGIVEPSEQPAAAALRELLEETRITAEVERLALLTTDPDVVYPNGDTLPVRLDVLPLPLRLW